MRSGLVFLAAAWLWTWPSVHDLAAQSPGKKSLHAFLAVAKGSKRTTTFSADAPRISAFWESQNLGFGDTIGVIWIAEEVGGASPKETEIRRAEYRVFKQEKVGEFSLSRPAGKTWPVGKYRVELYINGAIADVVKFTINPGVTIQTH